ncbi:MAG: flagellar motor switch protein FliG [SAR324 cluster bacterium]|nr:flagellar motor switch protein FliG [SAR324 cluster bacterium]MCZ6531623.1 flagellar motor switch protein FliG [SAR324 cluster bacterium]MCZ6626765.1 flagellar motor switch protein FliG [SAR324 cluster bacterium]
MGVGKMTGPKKAAILLLALGEEGAADIIKNLEDSEIQQVGYYMARFTDVSPEELDVVLEEYYNKSISDSGGFMINASGDFVKNTLSKALGGERAKELVDNLSANVEESALESLKWLEPKAIANFITHEHPQTIALILAHLEDPEQTATVLKELPENLQADVVYRMSILESIQPGVVNEIDEVLSREMQASGAMGTSKVGGIESVAEMLNSLDKSTETRILATIEESNPDLAEQIRELMFTFEDMVLIDSRGMQNIIKEVAQPELVLALKTASEPIKELIFASMSQRAADMLREDLEVMGPVKVSDVEKAQQNMVKIARRMEEEGKIVIGGRGGGDVV